jgi:EAL domain-containing protein (putative c-di-GMP-specific phosphodiesterase class I)
VVGRICRHGDIGSHCSVWIARLGQRCVRWYSSLSNLQAFPVRRLKIDGSFVSGIGENQDNEKIVEAVVGLGHSLGLTVIAEGVETEEQVAFLKARKCDEIQGYLVSKPLSAEEFEVFLKDREKAGKN